MICAEKIESSEATLPEVLDAREERVHLQQCLLAEFGKPLICFTLNIAGPHKAFPLAEQAFQEGKRLISQQMERAGASVVVHKETIGKTGYTEYYSVNADAEQVKKQMVAVEESCPLGRLFDIDVIRTDGMKISRRDIGLESRKCLICNSPAVVCARSRAHSADEVARKTVEIIQNYFEGRFADRIAQTATRALLYEVATTPKPGLVDRANSGAHHDMDFFTFLDSASALTPCFRDFVRKGLTFAGTSAQLFQLCRSIGQRAEDVMYEATGGVNTHKGLIFSLGVICAAAGRLHGSGQPEKPDALLELCSKMTAGTVGELTGKSSDSMRTHGEQAYVQYGLSGVRGEASRGFPHVKNIALPVLRALTSQGVSCNDAGVVTLLHLIANVDDTNIIARSSMEMLTAIQKETKELLRTVSVPDELIRAAEKMDKKFIRQNISPGGCADLLAITFMLYFLFP